MAGPRDVHADALPPRAVLAVARPAWAHGNHGIGLHAVDAAAAAAVVRDVPAGPAFCHLTDELALPALRSRARELDPWPAWLFRMDAKDFVDAQRHDVRPLDPAWIPEVARIWSPDWSAEDLIRSRVEGGPSCAVYEGDRPVAWAFTHFETELVSVMGFLFVRKERRGKGYGRSVACALAKDILGRGKTPIAHVDVDNAASLSLTESLGFRKVKRQVWAEGVFA